MLDNPEKTARLLAALKAAVPFKVELVPSLVTYLRAQHVAIADQTQHIVSNLSYAGDEGGIVCHIAPPDKEEALVVSLTQVRVPRSMPLAAAVADYHNHRVKKLKKCRSKDDLAAANPATPLLTFALDFHRKESVCGGHGPSLTGSLLSPASAAWPPRGLGGGGAILRRHD